MLWVVGSNPARITLKIGYLYEVFLDFVFCITHTRSKKHEKTSRICRLFRMILPGTFIK